MYVEKIYDNYKILSEHLTKLNAFYRHALFQSSFAYNYCIVKRRLTREILKIFQIGYSPSSLKTLEFLNHNKISITPLIEIGVIKTNSSKNSNFDIFEGRITFPIHDFSGNVIGISARTLNDDPIKYINNPTSVIYKKTLTLFGLYQALPFIKEKKWVLIVEGNIDSIMCYQSGVKNVVALNGTALSENKALLLNIFADKFILCFDNDEAGKNAIEKGKKVCDKLNIPYEICNLQESKDPDEYIKKFGEEKFNKLIENCVKEK